MNTRQKNEALLAITCLLLLVAGCRFWTMAMDARNRAALNGDHSPIRPQIISHVGPQKPEPFKELDLTLEQRRQIDDILKASMPKLPPSSPGGQGQPHFFKVRFPMDKIRAVLTPEQRNKLDRSQAGQPKIFTGMPGSPPGPGGPQMFIGRQGP